MQDIVWCPGGDQTGEEWEEQFDFFKDFRNTSFDPRGAGKTKSYEDPPWSINTYAQDLSKLIQEENKIDIKPSMIQPVEEIKALGKFKVKIFLHSEVDAEISINVSSADTIQ